MGVSTDFNASDSATLAEFDAAWEELKRGLKRSSGAPAMRRSVGEMKRRENSKMLKRHRLLSSPQERLVNGCGAQCCAGNICQTLAATIQYAI